MDKSVINFMYRTVKDFFLNVRYLYKVKYFKLVIYNELYFSTIKILIIQ